MNFIFQHLFGTLQKVLHFLTRFLLTTLGIMQTAAITTSYTAIIMGLMYFKEFLERFKDYKSSIQFGKLSGRSDLKIYYRVICVLFRVIREYSNTASVFMMGPGFVIDVTCDYVMVKLSGRISLFLYLTIVALIRGSYFAVRGGVSSWAKLLQVSKSDKGLETVKICISCTNHLMPGICLICHLQDDVITPSFS